MSAFYVWLPSESGPSTDVVLGGMREALRAHSGQRAFEWHLPGAGVGVLEHDPCGRTEAPVVTTAGESSFWLLGDIYDGGALVAEAGPRASRSSELRRRLLDVLARGGTDGLAALDGEYVLLHYAAYSRTLTLVNDRFGGLPVYWARSSRGVAIASGVRGALMAPGVDPSPDPDAIREAVTFGGYRLGDRTNVASVKMLPGATILDVGNGSVRQRRYWRYRDVAPLPSRPLDTLVEEARALWERAVAIRLDGCEQPGQTLSGGLDSRAILAEAAPRSRSWVAVTYGIPGCDDARIAERAARAAGVRWHFHDLYGSSESWLDSRALHIQETDGLIELGDLMHVETLRAQRDAGIRVHHSGYIGDAVCGPTFTEVERAEDLFYSLPYFGTGLGMDGAEAYEKILQMVVELDGAPPRYALFEHKLPQSTNRWPAAWRPWLRVRKPFTDYRLFDFWQGLPVEMRRESRLYERMLLASYPGLFREIPNQTTGVPILAPPWRYQLVRIRRYAVRALRKRLGLAAASRGYRDERGHSDAGVRARLESTLLAPGALCGAILGREAVASVLEAWLTRAAAPDQVVGALYVFETYHRNLSHHLRNARSVAADVRPEPRRASGETTLR